MKILHGDCAERLSEIENNAVDMILTSPPYDSLRRLDREFIGIEISEEYLQIAKTRIEGTDRQIAMQL
jgi:DNA modification methylase